MCKLFTKLFEFAILYVKIPQGLQDGRPQKFFLLHHMRVVIGFIATPRTTVDGQAIVLDSLR
jgi:hypothetical protein